MSDHNPARRPKRPPGSHGLYRSANDFDRSGSTSGSNRSQDNRSQGERGAKSSHRQPGGRASPSDRGSPREPQPGTQEFFDANLAELAEPWDEDRTGYKPVLVLQGETYKPVPLLEAPPYPTDPEETPEAFLLRSPTGEFAYMNRLWKRGNPIPLLQNRREGLVYWDRDVVIPVLLDGRTLNVWMSLTPMEVFTLREGISAAKGTVVIGGLGMGYLLRKVCEKTTVERVVVVEQSQELLNWFGNEMCARYPKVSEVICGDAYDFLGKFGADTRYLFDIWPAYGDAAADDRFQAAKKVHPRLWGWGDYRLA